MKKYITGIAILLSFCILTGCGAQSPVVDFDDENMTQVSEIDTDISDENMTQVSENETTVSNDNQTFASKKGSVVKETEDTVYFFGKYCIYAAEKASKQIRILWKNEQYTPNDYMLDGYGIILSDKIYFLENIEYFEDGIYYEETVLSSIHTDGSRYQQAISSTGTQYGFASIYCSENVLYAYNTNDVRCYQVLENGSLGEEIPREETAFRYTQDLSEDYSLICMDGSFHDYLSPVESMERYDSLIVKKDTSYVRIDVESGSEEWVNFGTPVFFEGDKVFYTGYESNVQILESFDIQTKEVETVGEIEGTGNIRPAYADGIFYYMISTNSTNSAKDNKTIVGSLSISDKTSSVLFELDGTSGYTNRFSPSNFGLLISEKNLYYVNMQDYDAYLVKVPLDNPSQQEPFTEPIYRTRIGDVGTLANEYHDIYGEINPDALLGTSNINWLVIDESFAGAEKINAYLYQKEVADQISEFEQSVRYDEEFIDLNAIPYSYDSDVSCVRYFDGTYVSFIQEGYDYFGGAHGMPLWEGYVFDVETGERLLLSDILSNTEDELKDIVTKYFGEKIDKTPNEFWQEAKETVYDIVSLQMTDFVLTDEGICFYMHPYSVAAYVSGFQDVTIPYSEFKMKILE